MRALAFFLSVLLAPIAASAQGSVLQAGPAAPQRAVMWW
jgi:hypothetical protein